ncbi:hypothetical protein K1I93_09635, partial [Streptococcus australis]|nr:hypothetical protein [Streptococcus australis]
DNNYVCLIYDDEKKFYFNFKKFKDIINVIKGSDESTRFYVDTNNNNHNNNMKKKMKLFKKVEKSLYLENLDIDTDEILFRRPKYYNCIIEESFENYDINYEGEDGN